MEPILDSEDRDLEENLLLAGRNVHMSSDLRNKTLAALGVAAVGTTASAASASTWGWISTKGSLAWITTAAATAAVVGTVALSSSPETAGQLASDSKSSPQGDGATLSPRIPGAQGAPAAELEPAAELAPAVDVLGPSQPKEAGATQVDKPSQGSKQGGGSSASSLREELSHIAEVEAALRGGEAQKALALLEGYRAKFPQRKLGLEAEVMTIQALYESGSQAAARARAQRFIDKYPGSPLTTRAKTYLK